MSAATTYKLVIALALCAPYVSAISSLYIPGFDPQPVTANELGVGANGETTYLIAPGVSSGTLDDSGFYGPATLVVGPTTAALTYIDPVMGIDLYENCDITGDIAVCVDVVAMAYTDEFTSLTTTSTETVIETVSPFAIQGGGPATTTPAPGSSGSSVPTATADSADASYASGSSTSTPSMTRSSVASTGTAAPQTTEGASAQKANGAAKLGSFSMLSLVAAGSAAIFLLSA